MGTGAQVTKVQSLFGESSSSLCFSGQTYSDAIWNIPYSLGLDGFIEPGVNTHIWSPHLLHVKLPNFSECPRDTLLGAHYVDVLVNANGVFLGHHLVDGRKALLATLHFRSHLNGDSGEASARPRLERTGVRDYGKQYEIANSCFMVLLWNDTIVYRNAVWRKGG